MTIMTPIEGVTAPIRRIDARATPADRDADLADAPIDDEDYDYEDYDYDADDDPDGRPDHLSDRPIDCDETGRPLSIDSETPIEDFALSAQRDAAAAATTAALTPSRKSDGWTADRQRGFLDYIAQGLTVSDAATLVGMSATSAYAFRKRASGAAFAVGWTAALLLQRNRLVDELTSRAFRGQTETVTRHNGETVERHRYDNRLALALLTRLDKVAAAELPDRTGDARAARLVAQDWDGFLDLIADDAGPARAGMFLALRVTEGEAEAIAPIAALARADLYQRTGAGVAAEVPVADLDPARRADWTAEQWTRAEAAGLVVLAPPPAPADVEAEGEKTRGNSQPSQHSMPDESHLHPLERLDSRVWWDEDGEEWRTNYPPPEDFDEIDSGEPDDEDYWRTLTPAEAAPLDRWRQAGADVEAREEAAARDAWFALVAAFPGPGAEAAMPLAA